MQQGFVCWLGVCRYLRKWIFFPGVCVCILSFCLLPPPFSLFLFLSSLSLFFYSLFSLSVVLDSNEVLRPV